MPNTQTALASYLQALQRQAAEFQQQKLAASRSNSTASAGSSSARKRSADTAFPSDGKLALLSMGAMFDFMSCGHAMSCDHASKELFLS